MKSWFRGALGAPPRERRRGRMHWFSMVHIVVLLAVLHRWVLGPRLRRRLAGVADRAGDGAEPTVTVVVPMYDAELGIARTIRSVMDLDYPAHRLELVIVDDASRDQGFAVAQHHAAPYPNVHVLRNHGRMGWRYSFDRAVRRSGAELVLALQAGDELHPAALRHLVRRAGPQVAAVGARVLAGRPREARLGRVEAVRTFLDEAYLRSLDAVSGGLPCGAVPCVTGRTALYRREALRELPPVPAVRLRGRAAEPDTAARSPLHQLALRGLPTVTALDAVCFSDARPALGALLTRPARRLRQVLAELAGGLAPAWRRDPAAALHLLATLGLLAAGPLVSGWSAASGRHRDLAVFAGGTVLLATAVFAAWSRRLPREHRVHPLWLPAALVLMPVTSALLVPLAAYTVVLGWDARRGAAPEASPETAQPWEADLAALVPAEPEYEPGETVEILPLSPPRPAG